MEDMKMQIRSVHSSWKELKAKTQKDTFLESLAEAKEQESYSSYEKQLKWLQIQEQQRKNNTWIWRIHGKFQNGEVMPVVAQAMNINLDPQDVQPRVRGLLMDNAVAFLKEHYK